MGFQDRVLKRPQIYGPILVPKKKKTLPFHWTTFFLSKVSHNAFLHPDPANKFTEILIPEQGHKDFKSAPLGNRPHLHGNFLQKEYRKRMQHLKQDLSKLSKMIKVSKSKSAIQKGVKAFVHGWGKKNPAKFPEIVSGFEHSNQKMRKYRVSCRLLFWAVGQHRSPRFSHTKEGMPHGSVPTNSSVMKALFCDTRNTRASSCEHHTKYLQIPWQAP